MSEENNQPEQNQANLESAPNTPPQNTPQPPQNNESQKKKNKKVLIIVGVVVGVLIILSIIGTLVSGWIAKTIFEKGIETVSDGQVKVETGDNGGSISLKGDDGEVKTDVGNNVKLPNGFPSYVPIYPDSKLESASTYTDGEDNKSFSVNYSSSDSTEEIVAFFEDKISQTNGFKVSSSSVMSSGLAVIIAVYEADGSDLSVSVVGSNDEDSRTIQYTYSEKTQ